MVEPDSSQIEFTRRGGETLEAAAVNQGTQSRAV
jgi:hypothetical protein